MITLADLAIARQSATSLVSLFNKCSIAWDRQSLMLGIILIHVTTRTHDGSKFGTASAKTKLKLIT